MALNTRFTSALLATILVCSAGSSLSAQQKPTPPPPGWATSDARIMEEAYSLQIATFPSRLLAASVAEGLENLGWRPVRILKRGNTFGVYLGYSRTPGRAEFYRLELAAQEVAKAEVVTIDASEIPQFEEALDGPLTSPFADSLGFNRSWFRSNTIVNRFQDTILGLPVTNSAELEEQLAVFLNRENTEAKRGAAAAALLRVLYEYKSLPEESFFLARQLAAGELPCSNEERVQATEVCAELYMSHFQDWRRAWATTRLLINDPYRSAEGVLKDEMRRLALEVSLMTQPNQKLSANYPRIRSELRSIYNRVPADNARLHAKVELFFLKTYAWEGNWERVSELSRQFIQRNQQFPGEFVDAKFLYARSFEQTLQFAKAIDEIRDISNFFPTQKESLYSGYKTSNIQERQLKWLDYFERKKIEQESTIVGVVQAPVNPEAPK